MKLGKIFVLILLFSFFVFSCSQNELLEEKRIKISTNPVNPYGAIAPIYGQLQVVDTDLCDEDGNPVQLKGMSNFWINWSEGGDYANADVVNWLVDDWKINVYRVAMGVEASGGYMTGESNANNMKTIVETVVEACLKKGIYVIIDWHSHYSYDNNYQLDEIAFFQEMAQKYGTYPHVLYEIYNEPVYDSWSEEIKPYSQAVYNGIREYDFDNIVLVGSPHWCQDVDDAADDPLTGTNIMYTFHFYAGTHLPAGTERANANYALSKNLPLFVTEWGLSLSSGTGGIYTASGQDWIDWMSVNNISWCNWSIADKAESCAALEPGASETGGWGVDELTASGEWIKSKM